MKKKHKRQSSLYKNAVIGIASELTKQREQHEYKLLKRNSFEGFPKHCESLENPVESQSLNSTNENAEEIFTQMLDMLEVKSTLECFCKSFEKNLDILSKMAANKNVINAMEKLEFYKNVYNLPFFEKDGFEREGSVGEDAGKGLRFLFK